ncbi:MAG: diacylglycerol kinase family protein [Candidatus Zixiibacteriota bacterium]
MAQPQKRQQIRGGRPQTRKSPSRTKRAYNLVINFAECWKDQDDALRLAKALQQKLKHAGWDCYLDTVDDWDEFEKKVSSAIRQKSYAIVVGGGDGSVRTAAALVARAKRLMGILPFGQFNNIFHSLYGDNDPELGIEIITDGFQQRIDAGLANGTFFVGSLVSGIVPSMMEQLGNNKYPRLAMSWGKMAAKAVDETMPQSTVIKVDSFTFEAQPLLLQVHLLPRLMSLRFASAAGFDDGRLVLVYDKNGNRDMMSQYIRDLRKDKYQYNDGIQMIRGTRISIRPAEGRKWIMDSDPVEFSGNDISIEVLNKAVRVFGLKPKDKK